MRRLASRVYERADVCERARYCDWPGDVNFGLRSSALSSVLAHTPTAVCLLVRSSVKSSWCPMSQSQRCLSV